MADVNISIAAELRQFRAELAEIPGIGAKEARHLARKMHKELKAAERAAKKLASSTKSQGQKMERALEGAKNAAEGLGGTFGGVAGQIEKAMQATARLGGSFGPLGVALVGGTALMAGLGIATAAGAAGMVRFVSAADEAVDSLGLLTQAIPDEAVTRVEEAGDAMERAQQAASLLHVVLASELAPSVTRTADRLIRYTTALKSLITEEGRLKELVTWWTNSPMFAGARIAEGWLKRLDEAAGDYEDGTQNLLEVQQLWAKHEKDVAEIEREVAAETREATKALREREKAQKDAARAAKEDADAQRAHGIAMSEVAASLMENNVAIEAWTMNTDAVGEAFASAADKMAELEAKALTTKLLVLDIGAAWLDLGGAIFGTIQQEAEANVASIQGKMARIRASENVTAAQKDELAALKSQAREEKKAARRAYRGRKQLSRATAIAGAASSVLAMTASLAPLYQLAAPAIAAAAVAPVLATQLASIKATSPPSFAGGGSVGARFDGQSPHAMPDHVQIMASKDEQILTPDQSRAFGGGGDITIVLPDGAVSRSSRRHIQGSAGRDMVAAQTGLPVGQAWVYGGH